jgi:hypothetical protein
MEMLLTLATVMVGCGSQNVSGFVFGRDEEGGGKCRYPAGLFQLWQMLEGTGKEWTVTVCV